MRRLTRWISPCLLLALGLAYLVSPSFSLGVNQLCEMLATGNTRGLMMFYHEAGSLSPLIAAGVGLLAFLVPVLKPAYLHLANVEFFGQPTGSLLTLLSGTLALGFVMLMGITLWSLVPSPLRLRIQKHPYLAPVLIVCCAVLFAMRAW